MLKKFLFLSLVFIGLALSQVEAKDDNRPVLVMTMDGAIGPAFNDYLGRGLKKADEMNAQLLVIELDTPGGLLTSTRDMVTQIIEAPLPVAVYVTPSGSHAASAGTFILYASHIAAMDEGTNIGAATPVEMGGMPTPDEKKDSKEETEETAGNNDESLKKKALEDTTAFIRGLAELRDRNVEFAVDAVEDAKSLTAKEALEENVIDVLAGSRKDLLEQIDGKKVTLKNKDTIKLSTKDAPVQTYAPDWRTKLLSIMTDPNIAMILMTIGVYGLLLEFYNPGTMIPGTVGVICLIAGLFALNVLPINAAGIVLMIIGLAFIVAEMFVPSFGIMGIGGLAAFIFGATILFDTDHMMGIGLDAGVIIGLALLGAVIVGIGMWLGINMYRNKVSTGAESLFGETGEIVEWKDKEGRVRVQGEVWQAYADDHLNLSQEDKVLISKVDDLKLKIRAIE